MNIIIDSNALIAALIKDSITRKLIVDLNVKLFIPEFAFEEIDKYKALILKKSGLEEKEYQAVLNTLLIYVDIIPNKFLVPFRKQADFLIGHIDKKDVMFLAAALYKDSCPIWSDDKHMKKQRKIVVYNTAEIIKYLYVPSF